VAADQGFRLLGPPGSARVGADVGRAVEQRLHNSPGLLDAVLSGEELMVAGDRGVQQALVGLRRFAQLAGFTAVCRVVRLPAEGVAFRRVRVAGQPGGM
jgi:hypothetical protein